MSSLPRVLTRICGAGNGRGSEVYDDRGHFEEQLKLYH